MKRLLSILWLPVHSPSGFAKKFCIGFSAFLAFPSMNLSLEVTVLNPTKFIRATSTPGEATLTFAGRAGSATLKVELSSPPTSTKPTASPVIALNGFLVMKTGDVVTPVVLRKSISIQDLNNLTVQMRGAPGTQAVVTVTQEIAADAAAVVGTKGGTLEVTDPADPNSSALLTIPAGALERDTLISMTSTAAQLPPDFVSLGGGIQLEPSSLIFKAAASLIVRYPPFDKMLRLTESDLQFLGTEDGLVWAPIAISRRDRGLIEVSLEHFSKYIAALPLLPTDSWEMGLGDDARWDRSDCTGTPNCIQQSPFGFQISDPMSKDHVALALTTRANSEDRVKLFTNSSFQDGTFVWRVYVPALNNQIDANNRTQISSIGAFLANQTASCDDQKNPTREGCYEHDFEIVPGTTSDRKTAKATQGEMLVFMGTQNHWNAGESVYRLTSRLVSGLGTCQPNRNCFAAAKLTTNAWYELRLDVVRESPGRTRLTWLIDSARLFSIVVNDEPLESSVFVSLENLSLSSGYGDDIQPPLGTAAYFDSVRYYRSGPVPVNTFGPGNSWGNTGRAIGGSTNQRIAVSFQSSSIEAFDGFTVAVAHTQGSGPLIIRLAAGIAQPTTTILVFAVQDILPANNIPGLVKVLSSVHPTLFAGIRYWLVLETNDPNTLWTWMDNKVGLKGTTFMNAGTGWLFDPLLPTPAFSVQGVLP